MKFWIFLLFIIQIVSARIYERCELANELYDKYFLAQHEASMWTCIAEHQAGLDTAALGGLGGGAAQYHGLFQISDEFWCSPPGKGYVCGVDCASLRDDDIGDDLSCVRNYIHEEHHRISGDGFNAWPAYQLFCKNNVDSYISECFDVGGGQQKFKINEADDKKQGVQTRKVYDACALAEELEVHHDISKDQVATWVCIAMHESRFDTSAVGHLNWDGSGDHGIFQISDLYWCSVDSKGKACNAKCSEFEDADITDDVKCIKKIWSEHQRLSGDGFNAWSVYAPHCKGDVSQYISQCNAIPSFPSRRPGITAPTSMPKPKSGKIYEKCELAHELYFKFDVPFEDLATWVCIAHHESRYDTSAVGRLNYDGSEDHGLFQISDKYWCDKGRAGKACNIACENLEDEDLTDDFECVKKIHEEHTRLSRDGFTAWTVYPRCKDVKSYVDECFELGDPTTTTTTTKKPKLKPKTTTKIVTFTPSWQESTTKTTTTAYPSWRSSSSTTTAFPNWRSSSTTTAFPNWKISSTTTAFPNWRSSSTTTTTAFPSWRSSSTTKIYPSWQISSTTTNTTPRSSITSSFTSPTSRSSTVSRSNWRSTTYHSSTQNSTLSPTTAQTTVKRKSIYDLYLNPTTKTLPTFKPLGVTKSTTKSVNSVKDESKDSIESKPKNAFEFYQKYVLGGKSITVAPYNFEYIKNLTKNPKS